MKIDRHIREEKRRVTLYLIKPSNYDDDGYVVTHFRGVFPSNTLNCLAALTKDVVEQKGFGENIEVGLHLMDETVQKIPVDKICRRLGGSQGSPLFVSSESRRISSRAPAIWR